MIKTKRVSLGALKDPDLLAATKAMSKVRKVVEDRAIAAGSSVITMKNGRIVWVSASQLLRKRMIARWGSVMKRGVRIKVEK
ncbi:MAG: hypothetical protein HGB04_03415 [Chlorobiaceae bacterium]|nr:hypothetical protein [Chlorobiaceae bacterium]